MRLCGRRFSDNATGRFLTRDPLGMAGGLNLYAYAGNNPVNLADPSGLCPNLNENTSAADDLAGRHNLVNSMIDATEQILVTSALGAAGGGELDLIGEEVGAGISADAEILITATQGGQEFAQAEKVRLIQWGEKVKDLLDEINVAQWTDGVEYNIASLNNGERWVVKGGPDGTNWGNMLEELNRIIVHTHPSVAGPSPDDFNALAILGQKSAWIKSPFYRDPFRYRLK